MPYAQPWQRLPNGIYQPHVIITKVCNLIQVLSTIPYVSNNCVNFVFYLGSCNKDVHLNEHNGGNHIRINTKMKTIKINSEMKKTRINTEMKPVELDTKMKKTRINTTKAIT